MGVQERTGNNDGAEVEAYLRSTMLGPGYAWCAAFVHWAFRQCGAVHQPAREFAAAARWGRSNVIWRRKGWQYDHNKDKRISEDGDLFMLYYPKLGRIGHVGIITGEDDDYVMTVEGNTGPGGEREGQGVYRRKRLKRSLHSISRWH